MTLPPDYVYFIRHPSGLIKVGHSYNVANRLRQLERAEGCTLELLGSTEGGSKLELQLHKAMAAFRERGEWFRPNSLIADYLNLWRADDRLNVSGVAAATTRISRQMDGQDEVVIAWRVYHTGAAWAPEGMSYWGEWAMLLEAAS